MGVHGHFLKLVIKLTHPLLNLADGPSVRICFKHMSKGNLKYNTMYHYLIINSGHQTPLKNPFTKIHSFQQKGETANCVQAKCEETGGKTQWLSLLFWLHQKKNFIWKKHGGFVHQNFFSLLHKIIINTQNLPIPSLMVHMLSFRYSIFLVNAWL
jgi:hypothetical protein